MDGAPGYRAVHDLIYGHVQAVLPAYGTIELGDPRVRNAEELLDLMRATFGGASMRIETGVVRLTGPKDLVARETAGFFYAGFTLPEDAREAMLADLRVLLSGTANATTVTFAMPINRLVVDIPD